MILYLKDDTEPEKSLLCKHVCENDVMNQFWLHYNLKLNDSYLIQKWDNSKVLFLQFQYYVNFLKHMHTEYRHLEVSELLEVIWLQAWWYELLQNIKSFIKHCLNCQVAQWLWKHQEIEEHLYLTYKNLLSFKR